MVRSCLSPNGPLYKCHLNFILKFFPVFRPPFEYQTGIEMLVWIPNYHLNIGQVCYADVHYSDPHCITEQVSTFQMKIVKSLKNLLGYETMLLVQSFAILWNGLTKWSSLLEGMTLLSTAHRWQSLILSDRNSFWQPKKHTYEFCHIRSRFIMKKKSKNLSSELVFLMKVGVTF